MFTFEGILCPSFMPLSQHNRFKDMGRVAFSTTPPIHNANILLRSRKRILVPTVVLKQSKRQLRGFSGNFCFLYKDSIDLFFMPSSMNLLRPLTLIDWHFLYEKMYVLGFYFSICKGFCLRWVYIFKLSINHFAYNVTF